MTDTTKANTEAEAVSVLTKLADENVPAISVSGADGREYLIRRNDFSVQDISAPNAADVIMPKLVTQTPNVQNVTSLTNYVNRFKNDDTVTFADIKTNRIISVIDYHKKPKDGADPSARMGQHSVILHLPFSLEWDVWMKSNDTLMKHIEFAAFLEENSFDVTKPAGADLLELCRDLQVKQDMNFSASIRMGDAASVSYSKDADATTKDNIALPISFDLSIPVYFGEENVPMTAWMRRRIGDGKLSLGYKITRAEAVRQREFNRIVGEIESATGVTTVYGTR